MVVFPNCKINLGLKILGKRGDGFHNLETIFYPVKLYDALEIIESPIDTPEVKYTGSGLAIETIEENNLCIKAWHLLKKDFQHLPAIKMHLHKAIPMGAGLGGGSADAAFTLQLINKKFELNLSLAQLSNYALQLGSDCPFFMLNKPCIASGRGEILQEIELDLSAYKIIIVNPCIHINTGWAFAQLTGNFENVGKLDALNQATWVNGFEKVVFNNYPEIKKIKGIMYENGAVYASMSGSGSTVYGLFDHGAQLNDRFPENYYVKMLQM